MVKEVGKLISLESATFSSTTIIPRSFNSFSKDMSYPVGISIGKI